MRAGVGPHLHLLLLGHELQLQLVQLREQVLAGVALECEIHLREGMGAGETMACRMKHKASTRQTWRAERAPRAERAMLRSR
jgi:hypothetical protein